MLVKKHWILKTIIIIFIVAGLSILSVPSHAYESLDRGKSLYKSYCMHCHGESGDGDGPATEELKPRPRRFHDPDEMSSVTAGRMERAIAEGRPGTAMQGWSTILKPEEVKDLIEYIQSLRK